MRKNNTVGQMVLLVLLGLLIILTLAPFYLTLVNSLKLNLQIINSIWTVDFPFHVSNYFTAMDSIWRGMVNSIFVAACVISGSLMLSSFAAYSFARFEFPGKQLLFYSIIMFMMIPGFATLLPQFILVQHLHMLNSYSGLTLPVIAGQSVMPMMLFRSQFESLPKSLFESAEIEGAGETYIFLRIAIALSKPMIGTVAIITGLASWNNYIWPLVSVNNPKIMPVILRLTMIPKSGLEGEGPMLAGFVIASLPLILLFTIATKPFIEGITSGAIKA